MVGVARAGRGALEPIDMAPTHSAIAPKTMHWRSVIAPAP
jgi:hypothetical protein